MRDQLFREFIRFLKLIVKSLFLFISLLLDRHYRRSGYFLLEGLRWCNRGLLGLVRRYSCNPDYGYSASQLKEIKKSAAEQSFLISKSEFSFSVLIPVFRPDLNFFKVMLESVLNQANASFEVLIGFDGPQPEDLLRCAQQIMESSSIPVRVFDFPHSGISATTNKLAQEARNRFLLLMDHDDWIRPDLIFQYQLALSSKKQADRVVLYCDEYKIDDRNKKIPGSDLIKDEVHFPYFFINSICHCLLIPKVVWDQVSGLRTICDGAQDYDLCLRISELPDVQFFRVALFLYAWRAHGQSMALTMKAKDYAQASGLLALKNHITARSLDWEIADGFFPTSYRAIPNRKNNKERVHVLLPFCDQKELTLLCLERLKSQFNTHLEITAIDAGSEDEGISTQIHALGIECLSCGEPGNWSRLLNWGVRSSRYQDSKYLLFVSNGVLLEPTALDEMLKWIDQNDIGAVGACLSSPDERVIHGGMVSDSFSFDSSHWIFRDQDKKIGNAFFSRVLGTVSGVTSECLLTHRGYFQRLEGFSKAHPEPSFSGADFCDRLRRNLGLSTFYSPYARGKSMESCLVEKTKEFVCDWKRGF